MNLDIGKHLKNMIKRLQGQQLAGRDTDPNFLSALQIMPNPDPILRKMGVADTVYASIMADAHVLGDIRSIRGLIRGRKYRIVAGDDTNTESVAAMNACWSWMKRSRPSPMIDWPELIWQSASAFLTGFRVHELQWQINSDGLIIPASILDRPNRRFGFSPDSELMLMSKAKPFGELADSMYFLTSRHMPTTDNPYGVAALSACFWPWTFKTGGMKYFVQYCERHGLPWPIARYPQGTGDKDIDALERAISHMISNGYAVVQDGNGVELLTPNGGATLPQESLINLCNREMSKALTSQAMVAELQGEGARAASETAQDRQGSVNDADADIAVAAFNQLLERITAVNFGTSVAPPELEFYTDTQGGVERAQVYEIASRLSSRVSLAAFHEEMKIPMAEKDGDAMRPTGNQLAQFSKRADVRAFDFSGKASESMEQLALDAAGKAIESEYLDPVAAMLDDYIARGRTLEEFTNNLPMLFMNLDDNSLQALTDQALTVAGLEGMVSNG